MAFLWCAMTPEERNDACLCLFEPTSDPAGKEGHAILLDKLAKAMKCRLVFLQRQPLAVRAKYLLQRIGTVDFGGYRGTLICQWLLNRHRPLLTCFLAASGVPHQDGLVADDAAPAPVGNLENGIKALKQTFPPRDIGLYLGYLLCAEADFWKELPAALDNCTLSIPDLLGSAAGEYTQRV